MKPFVRAKQELLQEFTRNYLTEALRLTNGNLTKAAQLAGLNRGSFIRIQHRMGLPVRAPNSGRDNRKLKEATWQFCRLATAR